MIDREHGEHGERDELEEPLRSVARQYHEPPATPREAIWEAIQAAKVVDLGDARRRAARRPAPGRALRSSGPVPAFRIVAAIAALLILGIGIGRITAPGRTDAPAAPTLSAAPGTASDDQALRLTANRHLAQSETFLSLFRVAVRSGRPDEIAPATARELLLSNRLLLDSPAADDPRLRGLLEDLELVLAQIAQLPAEGTRADAGLITDGMEAGSMLPRLRSVTTDVESPTLRQGAL